MLILSAATWAAAHAQFIVTTHFEEIEERGSVLQYWVQNGGENFSVTPPLKWQTESLATESVLIFRNEQIGAVIKVKFCVTAAPKTAKELERLIFEKLPQARIVERFPCIARDAAGLAVIIEYPAADDSLYASRIGVIPYGAGSVEISLSGPASALANAHHAWTTILNSLQRKPSAG